jgi:hypothetical protein
MKLIKNILGNLLCVTMGHQWNEWEYVSDNSCKQLRTCIRCGNEQEREQAHIYGEWEYVSDNSCKQLRTCVRCGNEQEREQAHIYGEWEYVSDNSCKQLRTCVRCGDKQEREQAHIYGEWEYVSDNSCRQLRTCVRCGDIEEREHEFVTVTCDRCGGVGQWQETESDLSEWPGYTLDPGGHTIQTTRTYTYSCDYCHGTGKLEICKLCGFVAR